MKYFTALMFMILATLVGLPVLTALYWLVAALVYLIFIAIGIFILGAILVDLVQ